MVYNSCRHNQMIPPRNPNDLELLAQLAPTAAHLDALPPDDLTALADVFRLPLAGQQDGGRAVRRVLLEALVLEREHFPAYLQLPKFKPLPARTTAALQAYWQHLWTALAAHREQEARVQPVPGEAERGAGVGTAAVEGQKQPARLNAFDYYRAYQSYPKFGLEQQKMTYSPFPYYYNFQNYPYSQAYHPQQNPALVKFPTPFYKQETQSQPVTDRNENQPQQKSEKEERGDKVDKPEKAQKPEKAEKPDKTDKAEKTEKVQKAQKAEKPEKPEKVEKSHKPDKKEKGDKTQKAVGGVLKGMDSNSESKANKSSSRKQHEASKKQLKQIGAQVGKQAEGPRSNIINLRFLQCACLGHTISTSQKSFECQQCRNLFHFSCLHLSASEGKSCPYCTLTRHHAFTEALPRVIKSGWFEVGHKECFVTKLHLDADELGTFRRYMAMLQKDKEGVHAIEFRILRINEKAKVKPGRKIIKTSFPLLPNELRKIETRHWIDLKLKQITEPSLIFYLMTMIRLKDRTRIVQDYRVLDPAKGALPDLWAEQERVLGRKIELRMVHPVSRRMIELPVRGEFCEHLQCEDLLFFFEQFQASSFEGNNRIQCSHCKKAYTAHSKFIADPALHALLQSRPPSARRLQLEGGKVDWMTGEPASEEEPQEGEESGSES